MLIKDVLLQYLANRYQSYDITQGKIESVIRQLETLPASDLYDSNKQFCEWLSDGFNLKQDSFSDNAGKGVVKKQDVHIHLIDFPGANADEDHNIYKLVNQLEIKGRETSRIPDAILYINGLPLVVFEFKRKSWSQVFHFANIFT